MARRPERQLPVRKSFLIFGGIVLGVAVLGFVLMNFVGGGGGTEFPEETPITPQGGAPQRGTTGTASPNSTQPPGAQATPVPTATPYKLREGGRDPFIPQAGAAPAASPSAESTTVAASAPATPAPVKRDQYMMVYKVHPSGESFLIQYEDGKTRQIQSVGGKTRNGYVVVAIKGKCVDFVREEDGKKVHLCEGEKTDF